MNSQNDTYFLREFVASHKQIFDKSNEKFIYSFSNIACLCAHIAYLIMFYILQVKELVIFNIFSVLFYFTLFVVIRLGKGGAALLYLADIEVIAHAAFATHFLGWQPDFAMFFILIIPATFLTYTQKIYIPFIISAVSMGLFLYYKITMDYNADVKYVFEDNDVIKAIQITNAVIGVFVMMVAGVSNIFIREYKEFQLVDQREEFKEQASKDPLTHLFNRRAMNENIRAIRRDCPPRSQYVIGIGDIDNFKRINDTYGHDVGDKVLVYVSNQFINFIPDGGYAARWGGEEFLFVIPNASIEKGVAFTDQIHKMLRSHVFEIDDVEFGVTMTFGVSKGIPVDKIDNVITTADKRLYKGKNNGKNHTEYTD
ncbi:diguanylate cyclase (GGDEF) domain-containing protein [Ruminococcus flavefaciens]|uniref:Diguanylate cyclase (GGDEF) domain-containing protein n=2 Tax=Ruminococcus flavefaciens TaxID=1265 RepID=A0A1K1PSC0_RUMFL|nr:diguanylate cyclase (GGDEF) domain-containing protein [Ruminococcus flavefaciens]